MKRRRLDYLILLYVAIFLVGAVLQSCEFGNKTTEPDIEGPGPEIDSTSIDSIFLLESMPVIEETDSLFNYGYPLEASKLNDSMYVFQGDILIEPKNEIRIYEPGEEVPRTFSGVARTTGLWPNNTVFYQFSPTLNPLAKEDAVKAMQHITENSNLKFVQKADSKGYVFFQNGSGCSSYIGRTGYKQIINLSSTRCYFGSTVHEILHAVGFWHEQARSDRDQHIKILYENISAGAQHNFAMVTAYPNTPSANMTSNLDFGSLMLYSSYSFSANGKPTIVKLNGEAFGANRSSLSAGDIESLKKLYPAIEPTNPTEPPKPVTPEYENGKTYTINGLTVLRHKDTWFFNSAPYGWREVELRTLTDGRKVWYYSRKNTTY